MTGAGGDRLRRRVLLFGAAAVVLYVIGLVAIGRAAVSPCPRRERAAPAA